MRRFVVAGVVVVLAAALAACGDDDDGGDAGSVGADNSLTITAVEYGFELDGELTEGLARLELVNGGDQPHIAVPIKVQDGVTLDQVLEALGSEDESAFGAIAAPDAPPFTGLPGFVTPGDSAVTVSDTLTAGTYALVCFVPSPDGTPHFLQGMVTTVAVGAASGDAPAAPEPDGVVTIRDGSFELPEGFGEGLWQVTNAGTTGHEINVARLEGDATVADVDAWFAAYFAQSEGGAAPEGDVPAEIVGGFIDTLEPGTSGWMVLEDLEDGRYVVVSESENDVTAFQAEFTLE